MAYTDAQNRLPELKLDTSIADSNSNPGQTNQLHDDGSRGANNHAHGDYFKAQAGSGNVRTPIHHTALTENHVATPPIDVPHTAPESVPQLDDEASYTPDSRYSQPSPLEHFIRNRSTSISFNPRVKLDSGHHHVLEEPLKKPERPDVKTRMRGRSLLQEMSDQMSRTNLARAHSESDRTHYDPFTGQYLPRHRRERRDEERLLPHIGESRHPLLQSTVDDLATESELERPTSLTSQSTASPVVEEVLTPPDTNRDFFLSLVAVTSPVQHPASLEESSAWPIPRQQRYNDRAKSYTFGRNGSMRQAMRQNSRRSNSSSSKSPANKFLGQWTRDEIAPGDDAEGQVVGTDGEDYVLGKQIGFGGFSIVREAFKVSKIGNKERLAVKIVRRHISDKDERENDQIQAEFEHEVGLWRWLGHKHILPLLAVIETHDATYCFTRLNTGGTLFDLVRKNRQGIRVDLARRYAYQFASAIRYLHEDARVVHRDIKLENCLLDLSDPESARNGGDVMLCDFGMAEWLSSDGNSRSNSPDPYEDAADRPPRRNIGPSDTSTSIAGSLEYASPELLLSPSGLLNPVTDIWAFGVVVYALLAGDRPFQHSFQPRVQMSILRGEWDPGAVLRTDGDSDRESRQDALEMIKSCLEMDVEKRWTIGQVLRCRWLSNCGVEFGCAEETGGAWKL